MKAMTKTFLVKIAVPGTDASLCPTVTDLREALELELPPPSWTRIDVVDQVEVEQVPFWHGFARRFFPIRLPLDAWEVLEAMQVCRHEDVFATSAWRCCRTCGLVLHTSEMQPAVAFNANTMTWDGRSVSGVPAGLLRYASAVLELQHRGLPTP